MNTDYVVKCNNGVYEYEHRVLAAKALGRPLREDEEVHHVDGNKRNNTVSNLVICNREYHLLLERRTIATKASGNPSWRKCQHCGVWDAPENLYIWPNEQRGARHRTCHAAAERRRKSCLFKS